MNLYAEKIDVAYKCQCMSREAGLYCRGFKMGETVKDWMEGPLRLAISRDHRQRSPKCNMLVTEYVALPFDVNEPRIAKTGVN